MADDSETVDPQEWAAVHQTIGGLLRLQDPDNSDAWIQADTVQEVRA